MNRTRVVLLAGISAFAVGMPLAGANAADLAPLPYKAEAPPPALPSWTGFYVGINGGFGGDRFNYPYSFGPVLGVTTSGSATLNSSGGFGGGQVGYNWQIGTSWVAGLEADFEGSDIQGMLSANATIPGFGTESASAGSKIDWFGTVRPRLGYLVTPSTLFYVTGGWAYGHTTTSINASATGLGTFSASSGYDQSGWTVGGGLEYALNNWLSVKTEYLYVDLGDHTLSGGAVLGFPYSISEKTTAHTVKAGLDIKLSQWMGR